MSHRKDDMEWLKILAIVAVFFIIMLVLAGCQLLQKDRESRSDCSITCDNCQGLAMDCELKTERVNKYTQNLPEQKENEDASGQ